MKKIFTLGIIIFSFILKLDAQSNPDDFWLNNGFTNGDTVFSSAGWFYDDGGNDVYHQNQDWEVTFCSENGNPLTLDFSNFRTHFGGTPGDGTYFLYDYMTVNYPGANYVVYHDDTPEFSFTSQSNCISVGFHSDNDGQIDSGWVAEIFAVPPPDNNDPADAEDLTVGNTCSPSFYTNRGAFNTTSLGDAPCKEYFGGDVWFRVVVPPSGTVKIETFAGTLTYAILDIFRSSDATINDGERITCVDDPNTMPSITLTSPMVSPGDILYIRLFGEQAKSGLFGICASDPTSPVSGYTGPGGVGDSTSLDFWYKADVGVLNNSSFGASDSEQVLTWEDQSGNERHLTQSGTAQQAVFEETAINGFPALHFDGTNDVYPVEAGSGDAPLHWFAAGSFIGAQRQTMFSLGDDLISRTASVSMAADYRYFSFTDGEQYGPVLTDGQYYLFHAKHLASSPYHYLDLNGVSQTVDADPAALISDGSLQVGSSWDDTDFFNGRISELFHYGKTLNTAQEIIVTNYMAAKYGLSIGAIDYYDYQDTHQYDVAGIGRVDASNMHTKAGSAGILSVSGADDLDNNEYIFFGHDNGDFSAWNTTNIPAGDTNIVGTDRLWRVNVTGTPGDVTLGLDPANLPPLPSGYSFYILLVDNDGDFSSGATAYGTYSVGGELVSNNVTLSDGAYIGLCAVRAIVSFAATETSALESVSNPSIQVTLNYPVSTIVEIDYAVTNATATQGTDYSLVASAVTINPGQRTTSIIPLIMDDAVVETPDEYFDITISTATAGVAAAGITTARHTILNDDLEVEILASDTIIGGCASSYTQIVAVPQGEGPFTYAWTPSAGLNVTDNDTVIANPSATTTYTVEITDSFSNTVSGSIEIEVVPVPGSPVITASGSTTFCFGDSVQLSAPVGYSAYLWSTGATTGSVYISTSGNYNVIVTDSFGCASVPSADEAVVVNALPAAPTITPDGPLVFCDGDSVTLVAQAGYTSYAWSDMSVNDSLVVKSAGSFYLTATDSNGCTSGNSDTIDVAINSNPEQQVITVDGADEFCAGDSVRLYVPAGFDSYLWSTGETGNEIWVNSTGNYNVIVSDVNGCQSIPSADQSVTVNDLPPTPVITPDGPVEFCDGGSVTLDAGGSYTLYEWSDAATGRTRLVDYTGDFSVRVTDGNGCVSHYSDTVSTTANPLPSTPTPSMDGFSELCDGDSTLLIAPAGYIDYLWSDGETNDTLVVKASGSYSVIVTDANGCESPSSDAITITVYSNPAQPVIIVNGSDEICAGDSVLLSLGTVYNTYLWSNGKTTPDIWASTASNYNVTVTDEHGCTSIPSADQAITENPLPPAPVITPDGPIEFCDGGSVTLQADGSYAGYEWNDGITGQNRLVENTGEYAVRVTDGNGCTGPFSDTIDVTEYAPLPAPVVTLVGDLTFCEGDSAVLIAPQGYDAYLWSDGSTDDTLVVKTTGSYSVVVSNSDGCDSPSSDAISITVNPAPAKPVIIAGGALSFCEGDSVSLSLADTYTSYDWSNGLTDPLIYAKAAGAYSVIVQDANGCYSEESDPVNISLFGLPAAPTVTADDLTEFCEGGSVGLTASGSFTSYTWSDGVTGQNRTVTSTGTYAVLVADANGCESPYSEATEVTVHPNPDKPVITATGSLAICEGESITLQAPEGYNVYAWSDGSSDAQVVVSSAGSFSVNVTDANGCVSVESDIVTTSVNPLPDAPVLTALGDTDFCDGGSVELQAETGYADYIWMDDESGESRVAVTSGLYSVKGVDANGCISSLSNEVEVVVYDLPGQPVITVNGSQYVITGDSVELVAPASTAYLWSPGGQTTPSIYAKVSGDYSVIVENENGCQSIASMPVTITVSDNLPAPDISAGGPLAFCDGGSVFLSGPAGFAEYNWSNGATGMEIEVTESITITLIVFDSEGHESLPSDPVEVVVYENPVLTEIDLTEPACAGSSDGSIEVEASGGTGEYTYLWTETSGTGSVLNGVPAGTYTVIVSDEHSCTDTLELELGEPEAIEVEVTVTLAKCPDLADGAIDLDISGGTGSYTVSWNNGENTEDIYDLLPGNYSFQVTDDNNCEYSDEVSLGYREEVCFEIYEIITPNGDPYNETWEIPGLEAYPEATIEVFDRWGKRVYFVEGYDAATAFDGTFNGKDLPMDSYHYVIDLHNGTDPIIGNLTILR